MFSANPESCYLLPFEAYPHLLGADWAGCIPSYLSFPSPSDHLPWVGAVTQHQLLRMACGGSFFWFPSQEPRAALLCAFWGWCIQEDTGGCRGSRRCEEHCSAVRFPRNSLLAGEECRTAELGEIFTQSSSKSCWLLSKKCKSTTIYKHVTVLFWPQQCIQGSFCCSPTQFGWRGVDEKVCRFLC